MEALLIVAVLAGAYVVYRSVQNGKKHEEAALDGATRRAKEADAPYKVEPPTLSPAGWPFPTAVGVKQETAEPVAKKAPAKKTAAAKKAPAKKAAPAKTTAAKKTAAKKTSAKKTTGTKKSK